MQNSKDLPLCLKSDTFNALSTDFDAILRSTLEGMERMENDTAEINVKVKITLARDEVRDPDCDAHTEMRGVSKPKFDHTVTSVMQYKDKKTGTLSGNYELVWDRDSLQYVMRPIDNGQVSIFDAPPVSGEVVDAEYKEVPGLPEAASLEEPDEKGESRDSESENAVSSEEKQRQRFNSLRSLVGKDLSCLESMGICTIREITGNGSSVVFSSCEGKDDSDAIHIPCEKMEEHVGHNIVCVCYGEGEPANVSIECEDCGVVIFDMDNPADAGAGDYPYQKADTDSETA